MRRIPAGCGWMRFEDPVPFRRDPLPLPLQLQGSIDDSPARAARLTGENAPRGERAGPKNSPRSAEAAAKAQYFGDWSGAEDWLFEIAHAGALLGRTARPLWAGQEEIYTFYFADPAIY